MIDPNGEDSHHGSPWALQLNLRIRFLRREIKK